MKKIVFVFSCLSVLLGAKTLIIASMLNEVMPKLGYVAYQAAAAGSYSESFYTMNFSFANSLAVIMIIAGSIVSIGIYLSSKSK